MPTPDASQFTQLRKYAASGAIAAQDQAQKRTVTRTTQPLPFVSNPGKFLSSFSNKSTSGTSFVHINRVTGIQAKTKVPGGHVFGDSSGPNTSRVSPFDLSNYMPDDYGLYRINLSQYFSTTEGSIRDFTSATTESTLNPKSYYILKFSDRDYEYGKTYTFSTISSRNLSEMDLYIGKTNTNLTTNDVISCINDNTETGPAPTSNIKYGWISGPPVAFPNDSYTVRDFLSASDTVDIVALNYASNTLNHFIMTVKSELPVYEETPVTNSSFSGNIVTFADKQITSSSPFPYYSQYAHFFNLNSLDNTYTYTFETTAADLSSQIATDTSIILFNTQIKSQLNSSNSISGDDDSGSNNLSKLSNASIDGNSWCLAVTGPATSGDYVTGTFTLKITRTPKVVQDTTTETTVTDSSFSNDEVIFNKQILGTSPFSYVYEDGNVRSGHYFNLNNLSTDYLYTFETTAANLGFGGEDTVIALFNTQNKDQINTNASGILISLNDDNANTTPTYLSKLSDKDITGNWCLVVTSYDAMATGTFTLKITRTSVSSSS